jgi:hypothetical protein
VAPYVILAALYAIFMIGYVPAVICYLCSGGDRQEAAGRLITTSASAIVALLTFTPADGGAACGRRAGSGPDCQSCQRSGQVPI